ncbi:MAG: thioredoxin-dependent thiol peroxidase [Micavibrio sp.]|nr:thioredoxin-dependent thiol peroxidase [Micavibrio sp.]HCK32086.1 thioredoxin-dependent thiol peroxidase [Rhodospirillaceae bacterium]|tara:strand:- start:235 stop:714 length:480 start_codon:yes stop_codon:yes gene_type:complete
MTHLSKGEKAPDFKDLPTDGDGTVSLGDFKGRMLVLYFYPKDDTSGCTKEACAFEANLKSLDNCGVSVVGVSKDSVKKHDKFKEKYNLSLPLISDEETDLCERYGVWKEKSMYGRSYMGIERSTFLIDGDGTIQRVWPKVKVNGHVEDVLEAVKQAKAA